MNKISNELKNVMVGNVTPNFVMIGGMIADDKNLSYKAQGIFMYMARKSTIPGWVFYKSDLASGKDKYSSVENGIKELIAEGYLLRTKVRCEKGRFSHTAYAISHDKSFAHLTEEQKQLFGLNESISEVAPQGDFPRVDFPRVENQTLNKKDSNKKDLIIEEEDKHTHIYNLFNDNIGRLGTITKPKMDKLIKDNGYELIIKAIEISADSGGRSFKYLESTVNDLNGTKPSNKRKAKEKRERAKTNNTKKPYSSFTDFKQREYDFEELEKKLLGWDVEEEPTPQPQKHKQQNDNYMEKMAVLPY